MNLIFYLAIERIPIGLAVTLEFIGLIGRAFFCSKRFVDYLWVLLAAAGVLIAPWTNNGINVLESYLLCWRALLGFISSWEEGFKNNERRRGCCNWNALCFPINCAFGIMGNGFSNLTPTFLSLG
jgi:inner membrane transporter RhtA